MAQLAKFISKTSIKCPEEVNTNFPGFYPIRYMESCSISLKDVFRTQSDIYNEIFCENRLTFLDFFRYML